MSGGTLFSSEYCPGGQYSRGDIIHSDNGISPGPIFVMEVMVFGLYTAYPVDYANHCIV